MRLIVYTRQDLIDRSREAVPADGAIGPISHRDAALLLEGCWPAEAALGEGQSLDEVIGGRFAWIDRLAAEMAESLAAVAFSTAEGDRIGVASAAYLNNLALRYYLTKLIRPLAYLAERAPVRPGDSLELVAAAWRDQDYADLFSRYCHQAGVACRVRWIEGNQPPATAFPPNQRWRRCLGRLADRLQPPVGPRSLGRRVVLCGNPEILEPVARELLARGCPLWWLVDRFAAGRSIRWRRMGIAQLVCNSSLGKENRLTADVPAALTCLGVDLAVPVRRWLAARVATHGPRQTRLVEQIDGHLRQVRPEAVVLDEDATAMARAAVAVARRHGAGSFVVQHGVPYCRFGFTPPAADRVLVWGATSRQRLLDWGTPEERIGVTGSPRHDAPPAARRASLPENPSPAIPGRAPRILLLGTVAPRDDRPDATALHLTGQTYARMLRMAVAVVAEADGAELVVRPHPRAGDDRVLRAMVARFPSLRVRWAEGGRLSRWFAGVDCVLSCGSSAGVEATLVGLPVIQLAPPGATGFLPHEPWGLAGTAHNEAELRRLLTRLAADGWRGAAAPDSDVFAALGRQAAALVADEVLAPRPRNSPPTMLADHRGEPASPRRRATINDASRSRPHDSVRS